MKNYLIVVDMQNDFVTGALGSPAAEKTVPVIRKMLENFTGEVIFTRDTHGEDYMDTREGKHLPVPHCIRGSSGWEIVDPLAEAAKSAVIFDKITFGSPELARYLAEKNAEEKIGKITLVGVCTDICVVSNALLIKAHLPEVDIEVVSDATAGVTAESHAAALDTMSSCQIHVVSSEG